ncbi:MFS transporter [Hyphobacterium sp. HN65]|uniref:MFS transporter n=1 Tax=Hyphobacterium lacteum TaxID=3116575 RepID=A0ABU7LQW0_9PROT|nr:MFS transporter [Hyphobacterium sp. HN65]MEE2526300.1 MFS transporter [Hyphobacterium sp. HN65]
MSLADSSQPQWAIFRHTPYLIYWLARSMTSFAIQIQVVALGWQVYDITRNPLDLGLIGLSQFAPALILVLVTGAVADRFPRRAIMIVTLLVSALISAALLGLTVIGNQQVWLIFGLLVVFGTARAFRGPAVQALLPNIVPPSMLSRAIALNSSAWQLTMILGPVAGGLLYGVSPLAAYGTATALLVIAALLATQIPKPEQHSESEPQSWDTILAGFKYIWKEKIVLGALSLDLFAVLVGGAVALLPVFARDILEVGPVGLGLLRSSQGIGAVLVAIYLAVNPIRNHAGLFLFAFVALFGLAIIVFGLSELVWLSVLALAIAGGADMISVYIRETLIQLWTPDRLRGRVNAVNMLFIGASNELGEFRAGMTAFLIGAKATVIAGGVGTVAIAVIWARLFPELRQAKHLDGRP